MIKLTKQARGLTLIELMTTMAIISVISAISWNYFQDSKMRSSRSDAIIALTKARAYMEKCYSNYRSYSHDQCKTLPDELKTSPKGMYTIAFDGAPTATGYVLQATVDTTKAQKGDTECAVIGIDQTGDSSNTAAGSTNDKCWPK